MVFCGHGSSDEEQKELKFLVLLSLQMCIGLRSLVTRELFMSLA